MQKKSKKSLIISGALFLLFAVFTVMISTVDVQPIGPEKSKVGLAAINQFVFQLFGVNPLWNEITKYLGILPITIAFGFTVLGMYQLIKRKSFRNVDCRILLLGAFYVIAAAIYAFFELVIVNYRPILLSQVLEASYPSSHAMIVICIMATAMMQFHYYWHNKRLLLWITDFVSVLVISVTVVGRLLSGVHWFTDILGGIIISSALIMLYYTILKYTEK